METGKSEQLGNKLDFQAESDGTWTQGQQWGYIEHSREGVSKTPLMNQLWGIRMRK